jgi:hypothetical protein
MSRIDHPHRWWSAIGVLAGVLVIAGCTVASTPDPTSTMAPLPAPASPQVPSDDPVAPDPEFVPEGSAADNAEFARFVVQRRTDASSDPLRSADVAEALIAAGFARESLEVTADRTPLGLRADVVSFAVRVDDECIVGELRASTVSTVVMPGLATGRCLVGADASID